MSKDWIVVRPSSGRAIHRQFSISDGGNWWCSPDSPDAMRFATRDGAEVWCHHNRRNAWGVEPLLKPLDSEV